MKQLLRNPDLLIKIPNEQGRDYKKTKTLCEDIQEDGNSGMISGQTLRFQQ